MGLANFRGDAGDNTPVPPFHPPTLPQPRRAFFLPCPDAMPVEVTVLSHNSPNVIVIEAAHGTPFMLITQAGYAICNVAPVLAEHVRLLEVRA